MNGALLALAQIEHSVLHASQTHLLNCTMMASLSPAPITAQMACLEISELINARINVLIILILMKNLYAEVLKSLLFINLFK